MAGRAISVRPCDLRRDSLAGRPCGRAVRASATWSIHLASVDRTRVLAGGVDLHHLAVVTAGDDAGAVGCRRENAAVMQGDACLLRRRARPCSALLRRTNTAVSPRKCTAMTGPSATGRIRLVTEGVWRRASLRGDRTLSSRTIRSRSRPDLLLRQMPSDEDQPALALFVVLPRPLMIAVEDHVHALEHEAIRIVLECENSLGAQDRRALLRHQLLDPRKELVGIERLVGRNEIDCISSS